MLAPPAEAKQIGASKPPRVSGPLEMSGSSCAKDKATYEGQTIAILQSCIFLYEFQIAPPMETDPLRNYGVGWVQATVDSVNGWCATKVGTELTLPATVSLHDVAPRRKVTTKKKRRARVRLGVDAEGYAVENASVSQRFDLYPRVLAPSVSKSNRFLRTTWRGKESSKLAFALGAEISWETLDAPNVRGGLGRMSFVKSRGC